MTESSLTLCLLPGDGIGQEVVPAAAQVLTALKLPIATATYPVGWECFQQTGSALPDETLRAIQTHRYALFGATSSPTGGAPGYRSPILTLRKQLDLYANLRPIQSLPIAASRPNIDLLLVRENTECLYVRRERWLDADTVVAERLITRQASTRIGTLAAQLASQRKGRLTICHKANVLTQSDGLFRSAVWSAAQAAAPGIEIEERIVDALAHDLVLRPERFDVIVAPNLYGDILSDLASALVGGLGIAPSVNRGSIQAVYEPVHGSAPDIAGQGLANPTAALLSLALFLQDVGYASAAAQVRHAINVTLKAGVYTRDLGGTASTEHFMAAILAQLTV
jgi:homoisocitrate dehydrogenase